MKILCAKIAALTLTLFLFRSGLAAQESNSTPPPASDNPAISTSSESPDTGSAESNVRIVRLSETTGEVDVYRGLGHGYETALLNLPITQGIELRTGEGFAEVEFEDDSTLRLTPFTVVEFTQLVREPSGATATIVNVFGGTVYVSLASTPSNQFTLTFAHQRATLSPSSHVRLFLSDAGASLAILHGEAQVETPTGSTAAAKNKTVNFAFLTPTEISLGKNFEEPYDAWDNQAIDYHKHYAHAGLYGAAAGGYGISDMNYYGRFIATGCGQLWRPYFAGSVWDPFANGSWVWYPQWGYTWVSPYPWGWTPYHYGSWEYCPNYGWGWRPYGVWRGIGNWPSRLVKPPQKPRYGFRPYPSRPPAPPLRGVPSVVAVNRTPPHIATVNPRSGFVIPRDSAGMGVPRATFGNLGHVSGRLDQRGSDSIALNSHPIVVQSARADGHSLAAPYGGAGSAARELTFAGRTSNASEGPRGSYSGGGSRSSYSGGGYHSSGGGGGYTGGVSSGGGGHSGGVSSSAGGSGRR
jgi:FecR protein